MAEKVKIARQGMTWRHIAIVVTMCLSIFTAVGIILLLQLVLSPVAQHFGVPSRNLSVHYLCYLAKWPVVFQEVFSLISSTRRPFVASQLSWSSCLTSDSLSIQRSGAIG